MKNRKMARFPMPILVLGGVFALILLIGCGVKGSGGTPPPTAFEVALVPGKMTQEGATNLDAMFAYVKGTGVAGGWVENQAGNKLPNSDLIYENLKGRYELLLTRPADGFPSGEYVLKYMENGTTKDYKPGQLAWTALPRFPSSPTLSWDDLWRALTVQYNAIPGANVAYFLRLYNPDSGYLRKETYENQGNQIRETLPETGRIQVMLIGDIKEAGVLKARIMHFFLAQSF